MKLLRVQANNFGIFHDQEWDFGNEPFRLVFGPNEAGKSTLLELLRNALFGFPEQTDYAWPSHQGEMSVEISAQLDDRRRLKFRRRKGRKNIVRGQIDAEDNGGDYDEVDVHSLADLLGHASPELFQNVFAFSLDELSKGSDSLTHARLSEALFGSGIGGLSNLHRVHELLRGQHSELFAPRARKRPINSLLNDLRDLDQQFQQQSVAQPREFEALRAQQLEAAQSEKQLLATLASQRHQADQLKRRQQAFGLWQRYKALQELVQDHPDRANITAEQFDRYEEIHRQCENRLLNIAQLRSEVQLKTKQLSSCAPDKRILESAERIRTMSRDTNRIGAMRKDSPLRQRESAGLHEQIQVRLQPYATILAPERWEDCLVGIANRDVLRKLVTQYQSMSQAERAAQQKIQHLKVEIARLGRERQAIQGQPECSALQELMVHFPLQSAEAQSASELKRELAQERTQIEKLKRELKESTAGSQQELPLTNPPPQERIEASHREIVNGQQAVANANQSLQTARQKHELDKRQLEDHRLEAPTIPSLADVASQRELRNASWQGICQALRHPTNDERQIDQLIEEFQGHMAGTDRLADRFLDSADQVARRTFLESSHAASTRDLAADQHSLLEQERKLSSQLEACRSLWADSGLNPPPLETMMQWVQKHNQLLALVGALRQKELRLSELQQSDAVFAEKIANELQRMRVCDKPLPSDLTQLGELATRTVSQTKQSEIHLEQIDRLMAEHQAELIGSTEQWSNLHQALDQWQVQWQAELAAAELVEHANATTVGELLDALADAQADFQRSMNLAERARNMNTELDAFEQQMAQLLPMSTSSEKEPTTDSLAALNQLVVQLEQAERQHRERQELVKELERLGTELDGWAAEVDQCEQQMKELRSFANCDTHEEMKHVAELSSQRQSWLKETSQLDSSLRQVLGDDMTDWDRLSETSEVQLAETLQEAHRQIEATDQAYQLAARQLGRLEQGVSRFQEKQPVHSLAIQIEGKRAEFGELVDRWVPLMMADSLIRRAMQQFENQHQSELRDAIGDLLASMTDGKYTEVQASLDDRENFLVKRDSGQLVETSQLSTGTREVLYLAIRLAYVKHYCRDNESLPLVLDDVLVNCDETRAKHTLESLISVAERNQLQVLLLTCHQRTVDMLNELRPNLEPIYLARDDSMQSSVWESFAPADKTKPQRKTRPKLEQQPLFQ